MKKNSGITIIEIIVATAIAAMLAIPLLMLYQSGIKKSVTGVSSVEMLSEGRKIISQIHDDLKNSAIPYHGAFSVSFNDLLVKTSSASEESTGHEYSLYRFNRGRSTERLPFSTESRILTPLIQVRYTLEKNSYNGLFKLIRIEVARNMPDRIMVLSERVVSLSILAKNISQTCSGCFWNTFLELSQSGEKGQQSNGKSSMQFYDVVYSDFFNTLAKNPFAPRNWFSGMTFSPN